MLVLDHVSPATRLLEKRRQMFEVQEVLEHQKEAFNQKEEVFKRQEDGLKKKDLDLQESLIKFSKFLQENDSKISRAEKKSREEIALRLEKEAEIAELQDNLQQLKTSCDEVHTVIEQNVKYQRYLESVVEADNDLPDIQEILNRYANFIRGCRYVPLTIYQHEPLRSSLRTEPVRKPSLLNLLHAISRCCPGIPMDESTVI